MLDVQHEALAHAEAQGLPTRRDEAWHYTDWARLIEKKGIPPKEGEKGATPLDLHALTPVRAHFHNGIMALHGTDAALVLVPYTPQAATLNFDGLASYNLAQAQDGLTLHVPTTPAQPLEVYVSGDAPAAMRHHITIAAGAELTLIEHVNCTAPQNIWGHISLAEGASLHMVRLHYGSTSVNTRHIDMAASTQLHLSDFILGGALVRHETHINLQGEQAEAHLHSAVLGQGKNHNDISCVLNHQAPHTRSHTTAHNVLRQSARGIFQGKVIVARDAQHVDARQHVAAIMLSDEAEMDTKPELEIYADDVACAHGAAIGALDEAALFFLRARGIADAQARQLLITAFIERTTATIAAPAIKEAVQAYLAIFITELEDELEEANHAL